MSYICNVCKQKSSNWTGCCFSCNNWGSVVKYDEQKVNSNIKGNALTTTTLGSIEKFDVKKIATGKKEFDRVLGGGLVPGSIILIGGEPGIGKSTLLLQVFANINKVLYITAEESVDQVKLRAKRLNINNSGFLLASGVRVEDIIITLQSNKNISVLIVDSIQTVFTDAVEGVMGATSQIRAVSQLLIDIAKNSGIIIVIVGHITKDGNIAGPKLLEHMVDTVLYFESDIQNQFRILRAVKHRHGSVNEIGVFEMLSDGLREVINPSEHFLTNHENRNNIGVGVFAGVEGNRPILVEFQILLASSNMPTPRRSIVGYDMNRLSMIIAILSVRLELVMSNYEIYLSVVGGIKIVEPAADLAVAVALVSGIKKVAIPSNILFCGELSLSGDVRRSRNIEIRIAEAIKMGFHVIICKCDNNIIKNYQDSIKIININRISDIMSILF